VFDVAGGDTYRAICPFSTDHRRNEVRHRTAALGAAVRLDLTEGDVSRG
jgi:hypothetical protein